MPESPHRLVATVASSTQIIFMGGCFNEQDGFKIERSLDGRTYTQIGDGRRNTDKLQHGTERSQKVFLRISSYHSGASPAIPTLLMRLTSGTATTTTGGGGSTGSKVK